jgi:hypothetical protein
MSLVYWPSDNISRLGQASEVRVEGSAQGELKSWSVEKNVKQLGKRVKKGEVR